MPKRDTSKRPKTPRKIAYDTTPARVRLIQLPLIALALALVVELLNRGLSPARWQEEFSAAYADFCRRVDALEHSLPAGFDPDDENDAAWYDELAQDLPLDPYAGRNPAEFFAVASEAFFVQPEPLAADYPEIDQLLAQYYRQDPLRPPPDPSVARQPAP